MCWTFKLMIQIQQKRGMGVEPPLLRSFLCDTIQTCHTYESVTSHIYMSMLFRTVRLTHMNEACHTMNKSCRTNESVVLYMSTRCYTRGRDMSQCELAFAISLDTCVLMLQRVKKKLGTKPSPQIEEAQVRQRLFGSHSCSAHF